MPDQINQIDADQNREIALLKQKLEDSERDFQDLRDRVRKLERWVWGAAAVISAGVALIGIAVAVDARPAHAFVENGLGGDQPCASEIIRASYSEEVSTVYNDQETDQWEQ